MLGIIILIINLAASIMFNLYFLYLIGTLITENEELEHRLQHAIEIETDETTEAPHE